MMTKKVLANELGYNYIGKGHVDCEDCFVVQAKNTAEYKNIGRTQAEAYDWLMQKKINKSIKEMGK